MQNLHLGFLSAAVLAFAGPVFRWLFGNSLVSVFLAVVTAIAVVYIVKKFKIKAKQNADPHSTL